MIRKLMKALTEKDYKAMAESFSENCKYLTTALP